MIWQEGPLYRWDIVGMNHYRVAGERYLFVAMSREGLLIKAEGPEPHAVFADLARQANKLNRKWDGEEKLPTFKLLSDV